MNDISTPKLDNVEFPRNEEGQEMYRGRYERAHKLVNQYPDLYFEVFYQWWDVLFPGVKRG